ncbi:MAG: F0F1 ATP synthase subunit gamma [Hyphomicrobiales bacterium]|nr:F0F1 ATP synthase subunit gamma [Hyphomicrobiales bacterium]
MASLKDLRNRINSVKSTQKITSAMKLIAATKLRRAQIEAEEGRPYASSMEGMLSGMVASLPNLDTAPKLLSGYGVDQTHLLIVVTGDRGLCGGFNANVARETKRQISALREQGKDVKVICLGRKGRDGLRREYGSLVIDTLENVTRTGAKFGPARDTARRLRNMYDAREFDVCTIIYNTFKSAMSQVVTTKQIIPFPVSTVEGQHQDFSSGSYELEPADDLLLDALLPANLAMQIFRALLESYASEQGARMTAMDNATRNADDMIGKLTLTYNRTRQAAITTELIEIISGAEAL